MSDLHTLVGAYALDSLVPPERDRFEDHLATCSPCRGELDELRATTAMLGVAVAEAPSAEVRERLMAAVSRTPQARPLVDSIRPTGWRRHGPRLLVAASVLAAVAGLGAFAVERERLQDLQTAQADTSAVLAAADAETSVAELDGGRVQVVHSPELGRAVVLTDDLPAPGEGRTYELWSIGTGGAVSAGVLDPEALADPQSSLITDLGDATTVALSVEDEDGSASGQPSGDPVSALELTGATEA